MPVRENIDRLKSVYDKLENNDESLNEKDKYEFYQRIEHLSQNLSKDLKEGLISEGIDVDKIFAAYKHNTEIYKASSSTLVDEYHFPNVLMPIIGSYIGSYNKEAIGPIVGQGTFSSSTKRKQENEEEQENKKIKKEAEVIMSIIE